MDFGEDLRFILLDPLVLPKRIFHAGRRRMGGTQALHQHSDIDPCDLDAVTLTDLHFLSRPLVHIAHRSSERIPFLVYQNKSLHLGAEGNPVDFFWRHRAFFHQAPGRFAHGAPPLVCILLRSSVFQDV